MPLDAREISKLEEDFRSGRNIRAYLPLCQALRRERRYSEAVDYCRQGLSKDSGSMAGHTMLARLLLDVGKYKDAEVEIGKAEALSGANPLPVHLLVEKCRCQIAMRQVEPARTSLDELNANYPMDPTVKMLNAEFRKISSLIPTNIPTEYTEKRAPATPHTLEKTLEVLKSQINTLGKIFAVGVLDLDSNKSCVEGESHIVEGAHEFLEQSARCFDELDLGRVHYGIAELKHALVVVQKRSNKVVVIAVTPDINFGKLHHRATMAISKAVPESDSVNSQVTRIDESSDLSL